MVELMFEKFDCPALFLARNSVLSAFATAKQTALVVDSGHEATTGACACEDAQFLACACGCEHVCKTKWGMERAGHPARAKLPMPSRFSTMRPRCKQLGLTSRNLRGLSHAALVAVAPATPPNASN
eukprot:364708-Chlamydomonas_euryale.AAC.14